MKKNLILAAIGLSALWGFSACETQKPVDPDEMAWHAGRRAKQFYEAISEERLPAAAAFFSTRIRDKYPDPLEEPLLKSRSFGDFAHIVARLDHVDWREGTVYFRVELRNFDKPRGKKEPAALSVKGVRHDAWVKEDGNWYYDGGEMQK